MYGQETPPFRAEHVGSLLRPAALLEARRAFVRGEIDSAALTVAEDRAIEDAVGLQERVGLRLATDGEFRRASYHGYFYGQLGDISFEAPPEDASGGRGAQPMASIKSRIAWNGPIHAAESTDRSILPHRIYESFALSRTHESYYSENSQSTIVVTSIK